MRETVFCAEIMHWDTCGHKNSDDDLYFISNNKDAVKIGRSKNVNKRLSSLQTGCSDKLEIVHVAKNKGFMEPHFHRCLSEFRINGEWFRLCPRIGGLLLHMLENPFPTKPTGTLNVDEMEDVFVEPPKLMKPQPADFGDTKMPFGRYGGVKLKMIPIEYMIWCVNNCRRKDIIPYFLEKIAEHGDM